MACSWFQRSCLGPRKTHAARSRAPGRESKPYGLLSCDDTEGPQGLSDALSAEKIDALLREWLRRLPHPCSPADRKVGYRYDLSILQAEFS